MNTQKTPGLQTKAWLEAFLGFVTMTFWCMQWSLIHVCTHLGYSLQSLSCVVQCGGDEDFCSVFCLHAEFQHMSNDIHSRADILHTT